MSLLNVLVKLLSLSPLNLSLHLRYMSMRELLSYLCSDCLVPVAILSYGPVFGIAQLRTTSPAGFTRATAIIAIKYSLVERPEKIDEILHPEISSFLMLIRDDDRVIFCALCSLLMFFSLDSVV